MAVSRVINNHPSVKLSTRGKVMKAITKIGYSPNDAARMPKGRMGRTIALVVPYLPDFFQVVFTQSRKLQGDTTIRRWWLPR